MTDDEIARAKADGRMEARVFALEDRLDRLETATKQSLDKIDAKLDLIQAALAGHAGAASMGKIVVNMLAGITGAVATLFATRIH